MLAILRPVLAPLLDLVYPPRCVASGCGRPGAWLCEACLASRERLPARRCPRCGDPWIDRDGLCLACRLRPPAFTGTLCLGVYTGPLLRAVRCLKFRGQAPVAAALASALAREMCLEAWPPGPPQLADRGLAVMPVPSHPGRLRDRPLDHTGLLASDLARALGLPADRRSLRRVRATPRQVGLSPLDRRANVAGAFAAGPQRGRPCLLVDDVLTTGATAREAAEALRAAGAGHIWLVVVARAAKPPAPPPRGVYSDGRSQGGGRRRDPPLRKE